MCDRWPKTMPGDPPVRSSPDLGMITNDVEPSMPCTIPLRLDDVLTLEGEESNTSWPATPESTPIDSPRGVAMIPMAEICGTGMYNFVRNSVMRGHMTDTEGDALIILTGGAADRSVLLELITRSLMQMAITPNGSRVVQKAFEVANISERVALAEQLRGHVWEACVSPHANHVLQRCIVLAPTACVGFVLEELESNALDAARHRFGCRIIERLIEQGPCPRITKLMDNILGDAPRLCQHKFGNFVIQHVLLHGNTEQCNALLTLICEDVHRLARHRHASSVVHCALMHGTPEARQRVVDALYRNEGALPGLRKHRWGGFVVREMQRAMRRPAPGRVLS